MNRQQQGVVLFLTLSLCLLFFLSGPFPSPKGGGKNSPAEEAPLPRPAETTFPVEVDGAAGPRGIVQAGAGMTVGEVLEKAGSGGRELSLPAEDLARRVDKSSRISIRADGEGKGKAVVEPLAPPKLKVLSVPVPLNTATVEELDILPGIGPATARAIVEFREKRKKFSSPDDLLQVPGIGPKKLAALKPHITLD